MKKLNSVFLILAMVLSLCACGNSNKKAFEASKLAYDDICAAYEIVESYGTDIYEAWRIGIYHKDEVSIDYLSTELFRSKEEIKDGIVYAFCEGTVTGYDGATAEEKTKLRELADTYFLFHKNDLFSACVWIVQGVYVTSGDVEKAQNALDSAKEKMKELSESYGDYEHYPNLKGFYTTTRSFLEFCQKPTGSFEQITTTINDYNNKIRDYLSDLEYIFDE